MSRQRRRTTNRRRQEDRHLSVRAIRRHEPDAHKLSRAFIGMALARAQAEADARAEAEAKKTAPGGRSERPEGPPPGQEPNGDA